MKVLEISETRPEYFQAQILHADRKFRYCKVSVDDVRKYRAIIFRDRAKRGERADVGPILCLGVRNGREVDLFRVMFFSSWIVRSAVKRVERQIHPGVFAGSPQLESIGRSRVGHLTSTSVLGVEINPRAERSDILIGSFDEMPSHWEGQFGIVFSNSLDHAQDPYKTAKEWKRVARPGGYGILCFSHVEEPTAYDRVVDLRFSDIFSLFGGTPVYFQERGSRSGFSELIVRW